MKRKNNLYQEICKIENIISAFNEVCRNTKNKKKVQNYKQYKSIYISRIYNVLNNKNYKIGKATKNSANVTFLINKLQMQFPGYDFIVYDGEGNRVRGNMLLGNVRDTYLE